MHILLIRFIKQIKLSKHMTYMLREVLENIAHVFRERFDPDGRFLECVVLGDAYDAYFANDYRMNDKAAADERAAFGQNDILIPLSWSAQGSKIFKMEPPLFAGYVRGYVQVHNGLIVPQEVAEASGMKYKDFDSSGFYRIASLKEAVTDIMLEQAVGGSLPPPEPKGEILPLDEFR